MAFQADRLPQGGLMLSRVAGEEIVIAIGGEVVAVIEVVDILGRRGRRCRTRLKVRAPQHVVIARSEVYRPPVGLGATR